MKDLSSDVSFLYYTCLQRFGKYYHTV